MRDSSAKLDRFVHAQDACYDAVCAELAAGKKKTHWMWFVFPQVEGLGQSAMARQYALSDRPEAAAYLNHAILGARLRECVGLMLAVKGKTAFDILGTPDDLKFKSSMTLFSALDAGESLFHQALSRFYAGKPDMRTLELLKVPDRQNKEGEAND